MSLVLPVIIIFAAAFGQAVFGFGGGLIAVPLLSLLLNFADAVTLALVLQLMFGLMLIKVRTDFNWQIIWPFIFGLIPGAGFGTTLLGMGSEEFLRILLVGFILAYLLKSYFYKDLRISFLSNKYAAVLYGTFSGLLHGLLGSAGPVMLIYANEVSENHRQVRASIILFLFIANCARLLQSTQTNLFTETILEISYFAIPCILLAMHLGEKVYSKFSEKHYANGIHCLLIFSVSFLVLKIV